MHVLTHDTRTDKCTQLGDRPALPIFPGSLKELGAFARGWILPDFASRDPPAIGRAIWVRVYGFCRCIVAGFMVGTSDRVGGRGRRLNLVCHDVSPIRCEPS